MPLWLLFLRLYGHYFPLARGKGRVTKWVYKHFPRLRKPIIAPIAGNIEAELHPWQWADFCTLAIGSPEMYTLFYFQSLLRPTSVIFDVGAYIGVYAFTASRIVTSGSIHVFEPNPLSAQRIRRTIARNAIVNIYLNECAVGNQKGSIQFYLHETPTMSALSHSDKTHQVVDVPVLTIDEYCHNNAIPTIDVIKIDVEGAELLVLLGAAEAIARFRPIIIVELHRRLSIHYGHTVEDTIRYLQDIQYALFTQTHGLTIDTRLAPLRNWNGERQIVIAKPV